MSGTHVTLTPLEVRRQLLLAESEINRVQIGHEWSDLAAEARGMTQRVGGLFEKVSNIVSVGMAGFRAAREMRDARRQGGKSWIANAFSVVRLGTALWTTFKGRSR